MVTSVLRYLRTECPAQNHRTSHSNVGSILFRRASTHFPMATVATAIWSWKDTRGERHCLGTVRFSRQTMTMGTRRTSPEKGHRLVRAMTLLLRDEQQADGRKEEGEMGGGRKAAQPRGCSLQTWWGGAGWEVGGGRGGQGADKKQGSGRKEGKVRNLSRCPYAWHACPRTHDIWWVPRFSPFLTRAARFFVVELLNLRGERTCNRVYRWKSADE